MARPDAATIAGRRRTRASVGTCCNATMMVPPRRAPVPPTLRPLGTTHDALDHHGRDAREHGLGHWGRQNIANRVRLWRLPSRLDVANAEHIPELPRLLM